MRLAIFLVAAFSADALRVPQRNLRHLASPRGSRLHSEPGDGVQLEEYASRLASVEKAKKAAELDVQRKLLELEQKLREVQKRHEEAMAKQKKDFEDMLSKNMEGRPSDATGVDVRKVSLSTELATPKLNGEKGKPVFPEGKLKPDYEKDVVSGSKPVTAPPGELHPNFVSRATSPAVMARWGKEEVEKIEAIASSSNAPNSIEGPPKKTKVDDASGKKTPSNKATEVRKTSTMMEQLGAIFFPERKAKPNYEKEVTSGERPMVAAPGEEHPRYRTRAKTETFSKRWGQEEVNKMKGVTSSATPVEKVVFPEGKMKPDYEKDVTVGERPMVAAPGEEHPRYRTRANLETFSGRWGEEEVNKMKGVTSSATPVEKVVFPEGKMKPDYEKDVTVGERPMVAAPGEEHPRYRTRANLDTFSGRWGEEEVNKMKGVSSSATPVEKVVFPEGKMKPDYEKDVTVGERPMVAAPGEEHPRYRTRANLDTFSGRWGQEEVNKMKGVTSSSKPEAKVVFPEGKLKPDYEKDVTVGERPMVAAPGEEHPRYRTRANLETFSGRWGEEEVNKMKGVTSPTPTLEEPHEMESEMQTEIEKLLHRAETAEAKVEAGEKFMSKYLVESLESRSALTDKLKIAERKVEELEKKVKDYEKAMESMLVKGHMVRVEAVERAKAEAISSYAERLAEIQRALDA